MRYLVRARVKPGREANLLRAIDDGTLGHGSVAGGEYLRNMANARLCDDGTARWVEVCFCAEPLDEERPYWEQYFDLVKVQDAHARTRCRDESGEEPWACSDCDCSAKLEDTMAAWGRPLLDVLRESAPQGAKKRNGSSARRPNMMDDGDETDDLVVKE
jgi:hypothetical protein